MVAELDFRRLFFIRCATVEPRVRGHILVSTQTHGCLSGAWLAYGHAGSRPVNRTVWLRFTREHDEFRYRRLFQKEKLIL